MTKDSSSNQNSRSVRQQPSPWLKERPIGAALRDAYSEISEEPIPQKLQDLLEQLKAAEKSKRSR